MMCFEMFQKWVKNGYRYSPKDVKADIPKSLYKAFKQDATQFRLRRYYRLAAFYVAGKLGCGAVEESSRCSS